LLNSAEQIFIKWFDTREEQWQNTMRLTDESGDKLYLDLLVHDNVFHLVYSGYLRGNLVIKYEQYKIEENKVSNVTEHILSDPANCSYPLICKGIWTNYGLFGHSMIRFVSCFFR